MCSNLQIVKVPEPVEGPTVKKRRFDKLNDLRNNMQIDNAIVTPTNTHISDSCEVKSKADIRAYLEGLREASAPDMAVNQRDIESQICEWRSHNFFYRMHIFRSRTKDVDLELKQTWYRELFCRVVSFFYFWD